MSEGQHFYWKTSETTQEEAVALVRVPSKHDPRMKGVWLVFRPSKKTHSFQSGVRSSVSSQPFPGLKRAHMPPVDKATLDAVLAQAKIQVRDGVRHVQCMPQKYFKVLDM